LNNDSNSHYPANFLLDNIVAVGNSTPTDSASASSDYGNLVDLFAPGTSIYSLDYKPTDSVVVESGTSMSTPLVSGALVLIRALHPTDTYRDAINRLLNGVDLVLALAGRSTTNGRLNIASALNASNAPFNATPQTSAIVGGSSITLRASNRWGWTTPPTSPVGDPAHAAGNVTGTLWWEWYAPTAGNYVIDTAGSEYDTALDIYTGARPSAVPGSLPASAVLTPLVSNDDDGANTTTAPIRRAASSSPPPRQDIISSARAVRAAPMGTLR
jgi:subtilisin family serine protease